MRDRRYAALHYFCDDITKVLVVLSPIGVVFTRKADGHVKGWLRGRKDRPLRRRNLLCEDNWNQIGTLSKTPIVSIDKMLRSHKTKKHNKENQ